MNNNSLTGPPLLVQDRNNDKRVDNHLQDFWQFGSFSSPELLFPPIHDCAKDFIALIPPIVLSERWAVSSSSSI